MLLKEEVWCCTRDEGRPLELLPISAAAPGYNSIVLRQVGRVRGLDLADYALTQSIAPPDNARSNRFEAMVLRSITPPPEPEVRIQLPPADSHVSRTNWRSDLDKPRFPAGVRVPASGAVD